MFLQVVVATYAPTLQLDTVVSVARGEPASFDKEYLHTKQQHSQSQK
jgi:hypothetical protein